jgi:hypothetical protein
LATVPNPSSAESISCSRPTSRRIACRTRTSLKGAWSTRIVNGVIDPDFDGAVTIPLLVARSAMTVPSSSPAPWITPVIKASLMETVSGKSRIVSVSA